MKKQLTGMNPSLWTCAGSAALALAMLWMPSARAAQQYGCVGDKLKQLDLVVTAERVEVTGGTANGHILLVSYGQDWDPGRYVRQFKRYQAFVHADGQGILSVQRRGSADSVWVAIDVESGRCGTTAGDPAKRRQESIKRDALKLKNGKLKKLDVDLPLAYMVLVRPGAGAWELMAGDGSARDDDGEPSKPNGKTSLSLDAMELPTAFSLENEPMRRSVRRRPAKARICCRSSRPTAMETWRRNSTWEGTGPPTFRRPPALPAFRAAPATTIGSITSINSVRGTGPTS